MTMTMTSSTESLDVSLARSKAFLTCVLPFSSSSSSTSSSKSKSNEEGEGEERRETERPHVTLTFAQTIDGYISGRGGRQVRLSGEQSMRMTHLMRVMHDGILVGVGTVLNDDPRLIARLLPSAPPTSAQPRPVVLDSSLRTPPACRLIQNFHNGAGKAPLIICQRGKAEEGKAQALKQVGCEVVEVEQLQWPEALQVIRRSGIKRLMVEGGATIIETLLLARQDQGKQGSLIDSLIITVSPNFAGSDSTGYRSPRWPDPVDNGKTQAAEDEVLGARFEVKGKEWFGDDAVWAWSRQA